MEATEAEAEPSVTRMGKQEAAAAADVQRQLEESAAAFSSSTAACESFGKLLAPSGLASMIAGFAAGRGSAEALAELLPPAVRLQLAPLPLPRPPTVEVGTQPEPRGVELAAEIVDATDSDASLLWLLDHLGHRLFDEKTSDASSLRLCVVVKRRILEYRERTGRAQPDFVQSILEAYGADEEQWWARPLPPGAAAEVAAERVEAAPEPEARAEMAAEAEDTGADEVMEVAAARRRKHGPVGSRTL